MALQTNCHTETFFDQALERATYCDEYLQREKETLGLFHGLPISLKESFSLKRINNTIGFVSFVTNLPASRDSALMQILLAHGAVFCVKTNIS
jgi:amidase